MYIIQKEVMMLMANIRKKGDMRVWQEVRFDEAVAVRDERGLFEDEKKNISENGVFYLTYRQKSVFLHST